MDVHRPVDIGMDFLGYRIEELIGRGGMGVVYRAYDLRLKRPVALKLVAPSLALDERFRERFARETELVMSLEHPNVVPIYDAGDVDGRLYIAMRLVDGTDLGSLLRTAGPLDPARTMAVCAQIASALDLAHARGLVHRDVKPSNVLLDSSGHVYLADFGLTRRLDDEVGDPGEDRSLGTPAYLAPEQLEGSAVDGRADVYSLGCLLYECLTGERVFPRGSRLAVAWAHLEEEPPRASRLRPDLSGAVDHVVSRAMAKDPEQRYPTCSALLSAAEEALGLRRSPPHRRRLALFVATGVLAAAVAAAAVATVLATDDHAEAGAAAPLFARHNTLARIDPATNKVSAVIGVGASPTMVAAGGHSVWVYNEGESTISEIDAGTNRLRRTTEVRAGVVEVGRLAGPVLAADTSAAWFVSAGPGGDQQLLARIPHAGRKREYRLGVTPTGVAMGDRAVWVVGRADHDYQVLKVDPATGRIASRTRFSTPVDSIAFAYGAVWLVGSAKATLYRIDARTARRDGRLVVGTSRAGRPEIMRRAGYIWVRMVGDPGSNGAATRVAPSSLSIVEMDPCCSPDSGEDTAELGSLWWYTWQTGSLFRQEHENGPIRTIRLTRTPPDANGPCLTSIASGSGSLWLTAAPSPDGGLNCPG